VGIEYNTIKIEFNALTCTTYNSFIPANTTGNQLDTNKNQLGTTNTSHEGNINIFFKEFYKFNKKTLLSKERMPENQSSRRMEKHRLVNILLSRWKSKFYTSQKGTLLFRMIAKKYGGKFSTCKSNDNFYLEKCQ